MKPQEALTRIIEHREIFHEEMLSLMRQIMRGELSPALIAAIVTGLRVKKETIGEITAAAQVMREFATRVEVADSRHLVDTCGTGGDAAHTFNISTAAAFVAAAAGARVAKHGGRSVSSKSGSADVLEALGVNLNQTPGQVAEDIREIGLGFMFAPNFHSAMKYAAPVRRDLGVRTLFNILGPLTNPAGAKNQLLGVFHPDLVGILARVLQRLGSDHVMVVHGKNSQGGLDEITIAGETWIGELRHGEVTEYTINPEDFGIRTAAIETIQAQDSAQSREMLMAVLDNRPGPAFDVVALNAGAAIYVAGVAESLEQGLEKARAAIETGAAKAKLMELIEFSNRENRDETSLV
ncbi:anthranilate phosphoribosyltransferase [Nitrosospira briensis]|uniref:Anthranilate phosphoribosyltransferase n=1 Tax=Nitrosospira briensis TaxID=35799 RepID=A0A1I5AXJ4_9PROT|nr:anthranilate phosphoribosyltransferase [Nitrosospira briensis]SFN67120.1 anthranilate phosphoribosyltransferase [Nitrosospira briensis]